jgi:hypothetical protein
MSSVISQGFRTMYEIIEVGTIKPGGSGTMGNGNSYSASVKFRSRNVVERMDKRVGLQEVETAIEFKIPCESEDQAAAVSEAIRKMRTNKSTFYISGDLPVTHQDGQKKDVALVTSFSNGTEFLNSSKSVASTKEALKA